MESEVHLADAEIVRGLAFAVIAVSDVPAGAAVEDLGEHILRFRPLLQAHVTTAYSFLQIMEVVGLPSILV